MNKTIKVDYTEQSKAVTTSIKVEYSGEDIPSNEEILKESQKLYEDASKYSVVKSMQKARNK